MFKAYPSSGHPNRRGYCHLDQDLGHWCRLIHMAPFLMLHHGDNITKREHVKGAEFTDFISGKFCVL